MKLSTKLWAMIVVAASVILAGCGKNEYPPVVTTNFINSCLQSGGSAQGCSCAIEKIQKKWTYDDFAKIEAQANLGDADAVKKIMEVAQSCR